MPPPSQERRFARVRRDLAGSGDDTLLDRPVSAWVIGTDRHLPQAFLGRPLRDVIAMTFEDLMGTFGVGPRRIEKLVDVLERVRKQPPAPPPPPPPPPRAGLASTPATEEFGPSDLNEDTWRDWCRTIRALGLEREVLGRFARRLNELPRRFWSARLGDYADKSLYEIELMPGHGRTRIGQIFEVFSRVAETVAGCPAGAPLAIRLLPPLVRDLFLWTEEALREGTVVEAESIRSGFFGPLFALLEADLGVETAAMVRRRIGADGPAETLERIGADVGLTRERVRQLTARAAEVTEIRWPEGRPLLQIAYAKLRSSPGCSEQLDLMQSALDACFALDVTPGDLRADVLAAWDRAGRAKRTPMDAADVRSWAAAEFPDQSPATILRWLEEEGFAHAGAGPGGEALFFSNDPLDRLLLRLHASPLPVPIVELGDGDDRSIRLRIERDPRFIEDESREVLPAGRCGFSRRDGRWSLRLEPTGHPDAGVRPDAIALPELVHLVVGGLVRSGVCDATVWGIHRFTDSILAQVYAATLPPAITPFILANTLVIHSDGLVRTMRRRRLRWDVADGSVPVRGKRGWVDHLATTAGVPMTFDELDAALRGRFQDYESYVIQQLNLDEDEDWEGDGTYGYRFVPGIPKQIPSILIPRGWELDPTRQNVSDGICQLVAKVVAAGTRSAYPKRHLRRVPWLALLCDAAAHGKMRWGK